MLCVQWSGTRVLDSWESDLKGIYRGKSPQRRTRNIHGKLNFLVCRFHLYSMFSILFLENSNYDSNQKSSCFFIKQTNRHPNSKESPSSLTYSLSSFQFDWIHLHSSFFCPQTPILSPQTRTIRQTTTQHFFVFMTTPSHQSSPSIHHEKTHLVSSPSTTVPNIPLRHT